ERRACARYFAGGRSHAAPGRRTGAGAQPPGIAMNLIKQSKGAIRILTLNRPKKRNALDTALARALLEALRAADGDETVRCVVLTGAGPAFCAGADLAEFKGLRDAQAAENRAELTMQLHLAFSKLVTPVVTAINGPAMGG